MAIVKKVPSSAPGSRSMAAFDPYRKWLGIFVHERPIDHYRLLGLETFEADSATIERAADQRMLLVRQYQTGPHSAETQQLLNEISAAKLCLLSPDTKAAYDQTLRQPAADDRVQSVAPPDPMVVPEPIQVAHGQLTQPVPYYRRLWFPPIALAAMGVIACGVWYFGNIRRQLASTPNTPTSRPPVEETPPSASPAPLPVQQEGNGAVNLAPSLAALTGELQLTSAGFDDLLSGWAGDGDVACWHFQVHKLPPQRVFLIRVTRRAGGRGAYLLGVGDEEIRCGVQPSDSFVVDEHYLSVPQTGQHQMTVRVEPGVQLEVKWIALSFPGE